MFMTLPTRLLTNTGAITRRSTSCTKFECHGLSFHLVTIRIRTGLEICGTLPIHFIQSNDLLVGTMITQGVFFREIFVDHGVPFISSFFALVFAEQEGVVLVGLRQGRAYLLTGDRKRGVGERGERGREGG